MHALADAHHRCHVRTQVRVRLLEGARGDRLECLVRPGAEPVDGAAVDDRGKLSQALPEGLPERAHREAHMDVTLHASQVARKQVDFGLRPALPDAVFLAGLGNRVQVFRGVQVRHVARVQNRVHVLRHGLHDDLRVVKEEDHGLVLNPGHEQTLPKVLAPLVHPVPFGDLDGVEGVVGHEGGEHGEGLAPGAADPEEQGVALGLPKDPGDPRHVLDRVHEHHQVHWLL
mmetsp:Transcript_15466/g.36105  ORF Transcript_15466/g.36105 Transcript_15466/m.36105 type:complete len:229 (+) Transcript_15466:1182-1868(+)